MRDGFFCHKYKALPISETLYGAGGSVISISSVLAETASSKITNNWVCAASKAALNMVIKYAAMENPKSVVVISFKPGLIKASISEGMVNSLEGVEKL